MAGIGFKLQRMLSEDSYFSTLRAYVYAAAISSGPWLFTIVSIGGLNIVSTLYLEKAEDYIFKGMVVYSYAFSLIITGAIQLVTTRFLSDRLFSKNADAVVPSYMLALLITTITQTLVGAVFYSFFDFSPKVTILAILLYVIISNIWIAMIYLTTLRNYNGILFSFLFGALTSLLGGGFLGKYYGFIGLLAGFIIGQASIWLLLTRIILSEFRNVKSVHREYFHYYLLFPQLAIFGFTYNLAIWVDKFIFWFSKPGEKIYQFLYFCPVYDSTMYIAFIFTIPSLALFIIRMETDFYRCYKGFYRAISDKQPLHIIKERKQTMVNSLYQSIQNVLKLQGLITLLVILFAGPLIDLLHMQWKQKVILRVCSLGTFLHVLLLFLTIIILYFDFRNLCMFIAVLFLTTNIVFSFISITLGFQFYGYGYLFSCLVTLITGFILWARKIDNLEYITFMQQPVVSDDTDQESENTEDD